MLLPKLQIGDLIVDKPIIQGGMGVGISLSGLASAVANEGGIGIISSVGIGFLKGERNKKNNSSNAFYLREEIKKARSKQKTGAIGVNIMVAITDFDELVKASIEEKVDIIIAGAGLPLSLPGLVQSIDKNTKTKLAVIVSSGRAANIICRSWKKKFDCLPDAIIVEGPKAGGHLGFSYEQINNSDFALEKIFPEVVKTAKSFSEKYNKKIPVIAAGGIFSGVDISKFLKLGASGVQMGTRFVATNECDADINFKQKFIDCKNEDDVTIIKSPVGLPGRAIGNDFIEDVREGIKKPFNCPWKCLKTCNFKEVPYCIADALINAQRGIMKDGFAFAGSNAYLIKKIVSVKQLFESLVKEYQTAVN